MSAGLTSASGTRREKALLNFSRMALTTKRTATCSLTAFRVSWTASVMLMLNLRKRNVAKVSPAFRRTQEDFLGRKNRR